MLKEILLAQLKKTADVAYALTINREAEFISTYPQEWLAHYVKEGFVKLDPVVAWSEKNAGWIEWQELKDTSPNQQSFWNTAESWGFKNGAVYSTFANTDRCSISICHNTQKISEAKKVEVMAIFDTLARLNVPKNSARLDVKHRMYLLHSSAGFSDKQIADKMSKSERTIAEYRKRALAHLKCKTLPQATAVAAQIGIL